MVCAGKAILVSLLLAAYSSAFSVNGPAGAHVTIESSEESRVGENGRRSFLHQTLAVASSAIIVSSGPQTVLADVSEGNQLPQGALQFGRVIRVKSDFVALQQRMNDKSVQLDQAEWENVQIFLRKVYSVSEDMKAIASGFYDPEKKKAAASLIDDLKKYSKAADKPAASENAAEFLAYTKKLSSIVDDFLDLLQDVPDEI